MTPTEITPELVLVDPDLRRQLLHRVTTATAPPARAGRPPARLRPQTPPALASRALRGPSRATLRHALAAASLLALSVLAALGAVSLVERDRAAPPVSPAAGVSPSAARPAAAEPAAAARSPAGTAKAPAARPPAAKPPAGKPSAPSPQPSQAKASQAKPRRDVPASASPQTPAKVPLAPAGEPVRRFAWAPVTGAAAYDVELRRGGALVFARRTVSTTLVVPRAWRHGGQKRSLSPGRYVWYVWPVSGGRRAAQASVRSTLVVR